MLAGFLGLSLVVGTGCSGGSKGSSHRTTLPRGGSGGPTTPRTTPGTTPRTTPKHPVVFVPAYIDATGKTDDSKPLQKFIDRLPNGRTVKFHRDGRYRVEGTLKVGNRHDLTFDGQDATVFATKRGKRDRVQWWVKRGSDIVFRNINVRGAHPNGGTSKGAYVRKLETQHGFKLEGVKNVELDHVEVTDVYGDFVYITRDLARRNPSVNVWIHDSTFRRNGRQGIAIVSATNVIIEHNRVDHTRRSTVDLEPNGSSWHISNVFILNNSVGKGRLLFVASHGQGPVDNVVIQGNQLRGQDLTIDAMPPGKDRRSNWVIKDNVSDTTVHHRPMRFFNVDGLVITGNTQRVSNKEPGVVLNGDCGTRVSGNEFGAGAVTQHGKRCAATLAIPKVPNIDGRGTTTTTTTTQPHGPGTTRPTGSTVPGTTPPAKNGNGGWLAIAVGACVLVAALLFFLARRGLGRRADH